MPSRLLVLAMYPLDEGWSGPTVRIRRLLEALERRVSVEVVHGYRPARRGPLLRRLAPAGLAGVGGVYVESSTALPSETDVAFLASARARGRPVLTYVRDAYQLFPDYYPPDTLKRRLGARLFRPAVGALRRASTRLAFPTRGLAEAVLGPAADDALLLPPGAPPPVEAPMEPSARTLLFVGDLRLAAQGGATLLEGVRLARERGVEVELLCVTRAGQEPPRPHPTWLRIEHASSEQIPLLLGQVAGSVIPRAPGAYNDLALPIKLMEYLSYGRPLIVTPRRETARLVADSGSGLVVGDAPQALADGIQRLLAADTATREAWGRAAQAAALANTWDERAERIVRALRLE